MPPTFPNTDGRKSPWPSPLNQVAKRILKTEAARRLLGRASRTLCSLWPHAEVIRVARSLHGIQLSVGELSRVIGAVKSKAPCNFLVFGLGNDSELWRRLNENGKTIFLEDDPRWLARVVSRERRLEAYFVDYRTRRSDWRALLERPDLLDMSLPDEIHRHCWDVILVDGPAGDSDTDPGRMKSLFLAQKLVNRQSGEVFVHDCDREVERIYCDRFLHNAKLVAEVGRLRHYRAGCSSAE